MRPLKISTAAKKVLDGLDKQSRDAVIGDIKGIQQCPHIGNLLNNKQFWKHGERYVKTMNVDRSIWPSGLRTIYTFEVEADGTVYILAIGSHETNIYRDGR